MKTIAEIQTHTQAHKGCMKTIAEIQTHTQAHKG